LTSINLLFIKMANVEGALSIEARRDLRASIANTKSPFIESIPKVELHVHIEGTLTPSLKWKFSRRNGLTLSHPRTGAVFSTLEDLQDSHDTLKPVAEGQMNNEEETLSFFEAYYGGFEVLKTQRDYYELAMHYFERAAGMNVRYCEVFFDPQGHTRTGTTWETMMGGFRAAQEEAEKRLNVCVDNKRTEKILSYAHNPPNRSKAHGFSASSATSPPNQEWNTTSPLSLTET
jgi:adenosine deaminase